METISRTHPDETLTGARTAEVDAFLDTLKTEQARFLDSLRQACSLLNRDSGQLAHVAASHSRLTQQFFDAQRLIMARRAEFDAEVAAIGQVAEENARGCIAAARAQVAAGGVVRLFPPASRRSDDRCHPTSRPTRG